MIRVCQYCKQVFGEKEPLSDKSETHGECDLCHWLFSVWYALYLEKMVSETASEFISTSRKLFMETKRSEISRLASSSESL